MGWNDTLKFDTDKLMTTKAKCESLKSELEENKSNLMKLLDDLKKDWNTPAGEKFFEEQNTDWNAQVDSYVKIIGAISQLLDVAIKQYQAIINEANNINI